ncbi:MAG: hypothetical protein R3D52_00585 [Xanthobacteraceae bacterium]
MRIATLASLVSREPAFELFVRIVRTVLIFDQIKDQSVGDCAHCAVPPLRFPTATTQPQELPSLRRIWGVKVQPRSTTYPLYGALRIVPLDNYFFVNAIAENGSSPFEIDCAAKKQIALRKNKDEQIRAEAYGREVKLCFCIFAPSP